MAGTDGQHRAPVRGRARRLPGRPAWAERLDGPVIRLPASPAASTLAARPDAPACLCFEQEGPPVTVPADGPRPAAGAAPVGQHSLKRGEAQRDHGACRGASWPHAPRRCCASPRTAKGRPATSRHLGRGRKVPRCRGSFIEGLDWLIPRRDALAFAVQLVTDDGARLGQGRRRA
jgi:hypothetical protein